MDEYLEYIWSISNVRELLELSAHGRPDETVVVKFIIYIDFEGMELRMYLDKELPSVICDGLKISDDFAINHFKFQVEFTLEGFPVEARDRKKEREQNKNTDYDINSDDDWKLFKDFAKNSIGDKAEFDLLKR